MFFSFSEAQSVSLLFLPLALISYVQGSGVFVVDLCSLCGDSKTVKKKANMLTQTQSFYRLAPATDYSNNKQTYMKIDPRFFIIVFVLCSLFHQTLVFLLYYNIYGDYYCRTFSKYLGFYKSSLILHEK